MCCGRRAAVLVLQGGAAALTAGRRSQPGRQAPCLQQGKHDGTQGSKAGRPSRPSGHPVAHARWRGFHQRCGAARRATRAARCWGPACASGPTWHTPPCGCALQGVGGVGEGGFRRGQAAAAGLASTLASTHHAHLSARAAPAPTHPPHTHTQRRSLPCSPACGLTCSTQHPQPQGAPICAPGFSKYLLPCASTPTSLAGSPPPGPCSNSVSLQGAAGGGREQRSGAGHSASHRAALKSGGRQAAAALTLGCRRSASSSRPPPKLQRGFRRAQRSVGSRHGGRHATLHHRRRRRRRRQGEPPARG